MWSKACLQPEGTFSFPCHIFFFFFITRPPASQRSDYSINRLTTAARDVSHHLRCVRYWPTLGKQTAEKKGRVVGLLSADGRSQTLRQINPPSSVSQVTKGFFARQWPLCSLSRSFSFPPSSGLLFTTSPPPFLSVPITRSLETMSHMHNWTRTLALPFSSLLPNANACSQRTADEAQGVANKIHTAWFQMLQERGGGVFLRSCVAGCSVRDDTACAVFLFACVALFVFVFPTEYKKVTASHCDSFLQTAAHRSQCGKVQGQKRKRKKKKQQLRAGAIAAVKLWRMAGCFRHVCPCNHRGPAVI